MPIEVDATYLVFLGLMIAFALGVFLYVRRVLLSFREGIQEGRR